MKPHKWAKEIIAWANGAEIEQRCHSPSIKDCIWSNWEQFDGDWTEEKHWEYRIKPQPKEPQYLYVYGDDYFTMVSLEKAEDHNGVPLVAKIKLETDDD